MKSTESGVVHDTVQVPTHVSLDSVTCGVTVEKFGVLVILWSDCSPAHVRILAPQPQTKALQGGALSLVDGGGECHAEGAWPSL